MAQRVEAPLIDEAAQTYTAYLVEAYGFTAGEVSIPEAYKGRELDWFGALNDALTELEDYSPAQARKVLIGRSPWISSGETLLDLLRKGETGKVRRVLRRH